MVNINAKFAELFTPPVFWSANLAFTIFAIFTPQYLQICNIYSRSSKFV